MSRFVTTLKTDQADRQTYKLLDNLVLADEEQRTIVVPAGFVTDFASKYCTTPSCLYCSPW